MSQRAIVIVLTTLLLAVVCMGLLPTMLGRGRVDGARSFSTNNLKQIGLAFQSHNDTLNCLPHNGGATDPEKHKGINYGWHNPNVCNSGTWATQILPFLEQDAVAKNNCIDAISVNEIPKWFHSVENKKHWQTTIKNYTCSSRSRPGFKANLIPGCYPGIVTDYAINLFINSPPTNFVADGSMMGFATNGGDMVGGNRRVKLEDIGPSRILVGSKALPAAVGNNDKATGGDEGIFSPGNYVPANESSVFISTGTGRGHRVGGNNPRPDFHIPWMHRDDELIGPNPPDWQMDWGGPFKSGTLFLFSDGSVKSLNYDIRGTLEFAKMLYPEPK